MKNIIITSLILISFVIKSNGQGAAEKPAIIRQLQKHETSGGQVQVIQDKRIDDLLRKNIEANISKGTVPGFRIRIFFQNNLDGGMKHAKEVRSNFIGNFPEIESTVIYEQPNWKVYVGYFRTYTDALRVKKQIESLYPDAFIKVDLNIDYTKL